MSVIRLEVEFQAFQGPIRSNHIRLWRDTNHCRNAMKLIKILGEKDTSADAAQSRFEIERAPHEAAHDLPRVSDVQYYVGHCGKANLRNEVIVYKTIQSLGELDVR